MATHQYSSRKYNNLCVSLSMSDFKNKQENNNDSDTLSSTSTVQSRAQSSIYSGSVSGSVVDVTTTGR